VALAKIIALRVLKSLIIFLIVHSILLEYVSNRVGTKTASGTQVNEETVTKTASPTLETHFLQSSIWYQSIVDPFRRAFPHYVTVITLDKKREPAEIFQDLCEQRRFMAKLVLRVAREDPAVLVIDKFYSPHACSELDANRALADALNYAKIPVIIGDASMTFPEHDQTLVLKPRMDFGSGMGIKYGLLRVDSDPRRLPLGWRVLDAGSEMEVEMKPRWMPSLSLVAAQEFDPQIARRLESKGLMENHPYTTLISESAMRTYSAIDLICQGRSRPNDNWKTCTALTPQQNHSLKGQIVVIGDIGKETLIGGMPGVILQANYIESLLDFRYVAPVSTRFEFSLNLVLAVGFAWIFFRTGSKKIFVLVPFSVLIPWILAYLLVTLFGYYMVIWFPAGGLFGLAMRYWRLSAERRMFSK
jgi:CHASE2 domain